MSVKAGTVCGWKDVDITMQHGSHEGAGRPGLVSPVLMEVEEHRGSSHKTSGDVLESFRPVASRPRVPHPTSDTAVAPTPGRCGDEARRPDEGVSGGISAGDRSGAGGGNGTPATMSTAREEDPEVKTNGSPPDSASTSNGLMSVTSRFRGKGKGKALANEGDVSKRNGMATRGRTTPPPMERPNTRRRSKGLTSDSSGGIMSTGKRRAESASISEAEGDQRDRKEGEGQNRIDLDIPGAEGAEGVPRAKRRRRGQRHPTTTLINPQNQEPTSRIGVATENANVRRLRSRTPSDSGSVSSSSGGGDGRKPASGTLVEAVDQKRSHQPPVNPVEKIEARDGDSAGAGLTDTGERGGRQGRRGSYRSSSRGRGRGRGSSRGKQRSPLLDSAVHRGASNKGRDTTSGRWRMHRMTEDYVNTCGNIMYPQVSVGAYGFSPEEGRHPIDRPATLGMIQSSLYRPPVISRWSPYQVACFEAAMHVYGKEFHLVAMAVEGKECTDVVEFYYVWKKTDHYKQWKAGYRREMAILRRHSEDGERRLEGRGWGNNQEEVLGEVARAAGVVTMPEPGRRVRMENSHGARAGVDARGAGSGRGGG
ncbi:unnamed protein product, partial [Discosporangium mesarthrocarpum]